MIKVLIVDDHDLVRTGITRLLSDVQGIEIIGEAASGEEAISLARDKVPNVVLMDANMPGIGGLEATRRLLRYDPDVKVVVVSVHSEEPYPSRFMQAGAAGYLTKGADIEEMVIAIKQVARGKRYLTPEIAQQMALKRFDDKDEDPFDILSEREMQVMMMITQGQKVQDISDKLCLSPKTVNSYRYRLFEKLKVENDVELTHMAIRHGLINTDKVL
ncbi:UvrY/SirA/GacA family response regulator transcription factor [Pleionea sp. CnH1-48]|uniref:UvrY/SirA/GacA family response regulator transcription factor n=1 Tax=Pleionea sp. CnH1-48 TaxID=2954494 RepID=UPI002096ACDE|nr:UvrY/SirA/GacA family response regulator transcription factor [Pleionea sp. CnH1-48]MCO7222737.1 UvrY/SirA/GacA family response regulator transcription factor [Pleionea sp. CnH1-48]